MCMDNFLQPPDKSEVQLVREAINRVENHLSRIDNTVGELEDIVIGDERRNMQGMIKDITLIKLFVEKWERREYLARGIVLLLGSNLVLTLITLAATFFLQ